MSQERNEIERNWNIFTHISYFDHHRMQSDRVLPLNDAQRDTRERDDVHIDCLHCWPKNHSVSINISNATSLDHQTTSTPSHDWLDYHHASLVTVNLLLIQSVRIPIDQLCITNTYESFLITIDSIPMVPPTNITLSRHHTKRFHIHHTHSNQMTFTLVQLTNQIELWRHNSHNTIMQSSLLRLVRVPFFLHHTQPISIQKKHSTGHNQSYILTNQYSCHKRSP